MKVETIETVHGNSVSFCTERGGIVTSLVLHGIEVLYTDPATLENTSEKVHGGIPVLFPNAGSALDTDTYKLPQHGFARDLEWVSEPYHHGFEERLESTDKTKTSYPYDFRLSLVGMFEQNNSFTLIQDVRNFNEKEMPVSFGLHPYFKVPSQKKKEIIFNFPGGEGIQEQFNLWAHGQKISIDNPSVPMEIYIPDLGTLVLTYSKEYKKIWIWSQPDKDFICIEPVLRDDGGLVTDPEFVPVDDYFGARITIALKE